MPGRGPCRPDAGGHPHALGRGAHELEPGSTFREIRADPGDEVISINGLAEDFKPLKLVPATIRYADGTEKTVQLKARVDTEVEIEYLQNGGVLHYVLRNLARA